MLLYIITPQRNLTHSATKENQKSQTFIHITKRGGHPGSIFWWTWLPFASCAFHFNKTNKHKCPVYSVVGMYLCLRSRIARKRNGGMDAGTKSMLSCANVPLFTEKKVAQAACLDKYRRDAKCKHVITGSIFIIMKQKLDMPDSHNLDGHKTPMHHRTCEMRL